MSTAAYSNAQAVFFQQYEHVRRDEVVGILLALFLGGFGIHHFYLRRTGLGILYACFCWTPFPYVLGFIECFFMPGRVREFNAIQAAGIAAALGISMPGWTPVNVTVQMPPAAPGYSAAPTYYPSPAYSGASATGPAFAPVDAPSSTLTACPKCQKPNVANARFCSGCGASLQP